MRASSSNAFLLPIIRRTNLDIVVRADVTKILFNDNNRATGVQFVRHGNTYSVNARNEIIISGGAINSPQLLMISGINSFLTLKQ
jgi:choline dehydrogenase